MNAKADTSLCAHAKSEEQEVATEVGSYSTFRNKSHHFQIQKTHVDWIGTLPWPCTKL